MKDSKPEVPVALLSSDECLPSRDLEVNRLLHSEVRAHRQPFGEKRLFAESTLSVPTFRRPESSGRRRARKRAPSWTRVGKTEWHLYEKGRHSKDAVNLEDMARDLTGAEPLPEIITQKSGERVHILLTLIAVSPLAEG
jgi:hypothetical protein